MAPTEAWRALVDASGSYDRLRTRTEEGIAIEPLYTAEDAEPASLRPSVTPAIAMLWDEVHDPAELDGVSALLFRTDHFEAFPSVSIPILLDPGVHWIEGAEAFLARGLEGAIGADPIGARTRGARLGSEEWDRCASFAKTAGSRLLRISGAPYAEAGATTADQLAMTVASMIDTLRALEARGIAPRDVTPVHLHVALDADLFMSIALLRAIRIVWRSAAAALEIDEAVHLHAETGRRILTRRDPWVNILRGTLTCFAGIIGGADLVTVAPFDSELGDRSELGRRLGRNTGLILLEEARLDHVIDPSGGSFFVERLTADLAGLAWSVVQAIERLGGMGSALASGWIEERLSISRAARQKRIAERKHPITGVTEFPDPSEPPRAKRPSPSGGLPSVRFAEAFEDLRDRGGVRIFLAALGPPADRAARTLWTENLLHTGGVEVVPSPVLSDIASAADAFRKSGARAAILCGSDDAYDALASDIAKVLRSAGAKVFLAGRPKDAYRDAIDGFIHAGADVLAFLEDMERSAR